MRDMLALVQVLSFHTFLKHFGSGRPLLSFFLNFRVKFPKIRDTHFVYSNQEILKSRFGSCQY